MINVDVCSDDGSPMRPHQSTDQPTISFDVAPVDFTEMMQTNGRAPTPPAKTDVSFLAVQIVA
jgi:hypothetical protein